MKKVGEWGGSAGMARLLTVAEAAKRSGLSVSYINRACLNDEIEAHKIGNAWVFTTEAFDDWNVRRGRRGNPNWTRGGDA